MINQKYFPALDSLRAIAVLLVIISHWFPLNNFLNRYSYNGIIGVTIFFVLSGYLITNILLKSKYNQN
jgi:peptidoglycan/LPS O-acetylase OafA/YrhL